MVSAMLPSASVGQVSESIHTNSFSSDNQFGVRAFERNDVLQASFLRDSSQTFDMTEDYNSVNWELVNSMSYQYDQFGKELSRVFKSVSNQVWRNTKRWDNFYSFGSEIAERNESVWSAELTSWTPIYKLQYTYNHRGQELDILGFEKTENGWEPNQKTTYEYDLNDFVSNETVFDWNEELVNWIANSRIVYTYNNRHSVSSETSQIWNDSLGVWENRYSRVYVYDTENRIESSVRREWNHLEQQWIELSTLSLFFNEKGQLSRSELIDDASFAPPHSENASYSDEGNLGELIHSVYNEDSDSFEPYEKELHYWSEHVQGNLIDGGSEIDCKFANPYLLGLPWYCDKLKSDVIYSVEVYDLWGRLFYEDTFESNATFRLNGDIPPGLYSVVIRGGLDYHTERVLIRN